MALVSSQDRIRVSIPHEPDQWVELRPLTARGIADIQRAAKESAADLVTAETTLRILTFCVTAWSYPMPPCMEAFESLDYQTFNWLDSQAMMVGRRPEDEKKTYEPESSLTSAPAPVNSRRNSAT